MQAGIAFALASAVLFGASTPFAKLLLGSVDPWLMAGLLYIGAGLGLAVVHILRSALQLPAVEARLKCLDAPWLAAVILFGGVVVPLFLMLGLARTDAATASLLLNLEGLATMGIAWVVFRENVDRRLLLGAFAILAGAALLSWRGQASFQWSGSLIAGACLCWGIDNNLTRKLSSSDPVQIAMLKGLVAGAVNLALAPVARRGAAFVRDHCCCRSGRFLGLRCEPGAFCAWATPSRHGTHGSVFLTRTISRCPAGSRHTGRSPISAADLRGRPNGHRVVAAPGRTARSRTSPRAARA
jgi:uncharacterized membrane protein